MNARREAMLEAACEYIRNAGGAPSIENFDEDHEPVGPMLREFLKEAGLVWEREGKIREVTASGRVSCPWDTDSDGDCHKCSKLPGGCFWHGPEGEGCVREVK